MRRVLITGVAGFIGFHLARRLLTQGVEVTGIDEMNHYYDVNLKYDRLHMLGEDSKFKFHRETISNYYRMEEVFKSEFDVVVNLAAYAGVRHSLINPEAYIQSNIVGFFRILEACKKYKVKHLVYASSASVYGANEDFPFSTSHKTDDPISLYGATKKSNELLANSYYRMFDLKCTGLRFFTAYGEWGRPDLAMYKFTRAILRDQEIEVYNYGNMSRNFTYIDDLVTVVVRILRKTPEGHVVYNVANPETVSLHNMIMIIEEELGKKAKKKYLPLQTGDIVRASADISQLVRDFDYRPSTSIREGTKKFIRWYREYHEGRQDASS